MKTKIIFWLRASLLDFATSKFIQQQLDCNSYAIIDVTDKPKNFFQTQKLVKFEKFWFFHDFISKHHTKPDLQYLSNIEEKYHMNLWKIAFNERLFYQHNNYYKFTTDQVLSILEQECKLFEKILDEVKPDFVIMGIHVFQHEQIFYELCKNKDIKILMLRPFNLKNRYFISDGLDKFENIVAKTSSLNLTFSELQQYLKGTSQHIEEKKISDKFSNPNWFYFKAALKYIFSKNSNEKTHYSYYGRTKFNVLQKMLIYTMKKRYREFFLNKNLSRNIEDTSPFIFFPLHIEQERALLLEAPFYTNQLEVIKNIVKSMPIGYRLIVKDHPIMIERGWRPIAYYKEIMNLPNVELIHHTVSSDEILKKCSLVISINGSAALEAAFYKKPSIIFTEKNFSMLPSIFQLKSIEELPHAIRICLKKEVNISDLNKFVTLVNENTIECDLIELNKSMQKYFQFGGFFVDTDVPIDKMKKFLEENKTTLEFIASVFVKKIKNYKSET